MTDDCSDRTKSNDNQKYASVYLSCENRLV